MMLCIYTYIYICRAISSKYKKPEERLLSAQIIAMDIINVKI